MSVAHPIYRVEHFEIVGPYTLRVGFDDATERTIDFRPVLGGGFFGPLRDLALFNQVRLDPEVHTLVWPNGADFDHAMLHDWPEHAQALATLVGAWKSGAEVRP
jgi:hypothetical protein